MCPSDALATVELDRSRAPDIAAFSRVALPYDLLSTSSVERSIFDDADPQTVRGVYDGGLDAIGAAVVRGRAGFVKLLAVHPTVRRRGVGTALLDRLESFARGAGAETMDVGTSAPVYVVPGVDVRSTEAVCFFEARGYARTGDAVNLGVSLRDLPPPSLPVRDAVETDLTTTLRWVAEVHPNWIDELTRGVRGGTCVVCGSDGFACYDVNRDGWFGPIATRPDRRTHGVGAATLLAALERMRTRGYERAEIAWATALPFYSKTVGARISRVFWCFRKQL